MSSSGILHEIQALQGVQRNPPLDIKPKQIDISGKHGTVLYLDPRRVRPLPENPRWKDNPGFSAESLRSLGRSIRTAGQIEAAKVCLTSEPGFDAQLFDGERRLRACSLAECMIRVEVWGETYNEKALLILSVVSNFGKEMNTSPEIAHAIGRFREMEMTLEQISDLFGKSVSWVQNHASLLKLNPEILSLLTVAPDSAMAIDGEEIGTNGTSGKRRKRTQGISFSLALNLVDLPADDQKAIARHVIKHDMPLSQARRYILKHRRESGQEKKTRRRPKERFEILLNLVGRTIEQFGSYEDMMVSEFRAILETGGPTELQSLVRELDGIIVTLKGFRETVVKVGGI